MSDNQKNPKIERRIQDILRDSGLPAERRAEVAEEFRGHLEQLVEAKRRANANDAAIEAALAAFGDTEAIRRRLRRRQCAEDHRQVLATMRQQLPLFVVIAAVFPLYIALFASVRNGEVLRGALFALLVHAVVLVGGSVVLYPVLLARIRLGHRIPVAECHPLVTAGSWFVIFSLSLVLFVTIFICGIITAFGALALTLPSVPPEINLAPFLWNLLSDFVPGAGPLLLMVSGLMAVVLAGVQRWRGVPEERLPAPA